MRSLVLFILTVFICSCGRKNISTDNVIDLLESTVSEITNLSDIATDVEYIHLQSSEESMIRYVYDIRTSNNKIYINHLRQILCFDNDGNYLYSLDKQGEGPEEYTYISDWDLSTENNLLLILDRGKAIIYDDTNDGFVYSKTLNFTEQPSYIDFCPDQKSILLSFGSSRGDEPYRNVLINLAGDTLKVIPNYYRYTKNTKVVFTAKYENIHFRSDKTLKFKFWLSDTAFVLDQSNKIEPYLRFDSQGKQMTTESLANFSMETMSEYLNLNSIMETSRYLFYRYFYEETSNFTIRDKDYHTSYRISTKTGDQPRWLNDDISGGIDFEPKFCINDVLYSWVDAITLKQFVAGEKFENSIVQNSGKKKALKELADSLDETDNPVLIVVNSKK